jgi:hypothetical protein
LGGGGELVLSRAAMFWIFFLFFFSLGTFHFSKVKIQRTGCGAAVLRLVHVRAVLCSVLVLFSLLVRPFDASFFCGSNQCCEDLI